MKERIRPRGAVLFFLSLLGGCDCLAQLLKSRALNKIFSVNLFALFARMFALDQNSRKFTH